MGGIGREEVFNSALGHVVNTTATTCVEGADEDGPVGDGMGADVMVHKHGVHAVSGVKQELPVGCTVGIWASVSGPVGNYGLGVDCPIAKEHVEGVYVAVVGFLPFMVWEVVGGCCWRGACQRAGSPRTDQLGSGVRGGG